MKHIKPTMSWAVNEAHLNEQLSKYWQREYEEAIEALELYRGQVDMRGDNSACDFLSESHQQPSRAHTHYETTKDYEDRQAEAS